MTEFNVKNVKSSDVDQAYDLLKRHFTANSALVPSGTDVAAHAAMVLHLALKKQSWALADNIHALARAHDALLAKGSKNPAEPSTARPMALEVFALVTGIVPEPAAAPTQATAAPAGTPTPTQPDKKAAPDAAPTNQTQPTAAAAAATDGETSMNTETKGVLAPYAATGVAAVAISAEQAKTIDPMLDQLTNSRVRSIRTLVQAVGYAERVVHEGSQLKALGAAKLEALKAGDVEGAAEIPFQLPQGFKPCGIGGIKVEGPMVPALNALLNSASGGAIASYDAIAAALAEAEKLAAAQANELRQLNREINAALPKERKTIEASVDGDAASIACEVVMKRASEIFTDAFGHSAQILEFDVPTLEFAEPHPDVPKVDPTFRFYAPVLADVLDAIVHNEIPWLYGESGCGKSEFWMQVAARLGFPVIRLNMDSHITRGDLVGQNRLVPGPTGAPVMKFIEGLIPRALKTPSILLIDEMDLGDPEVMPVLQPVLEGNGIRLLEDAGRYVAPHPWSRLGITANTIGLGSENMMYNNAHEQSAATRDRVARFIEMIYLPPEKELEVVLSRVPDADQDFATKVIQLANKVREGYKLNQVHQVFSTRTVQRAVRRHAKFAPLYNDANNAVLSTLEVTILNRCDSTSRGVIKGLADAIFV